MIRITQVGGNGRGEGAGFGGSVEAQASRAVEPCRVGEDQNIGWRAFPLRPQPLNEGVVLGLKELDANSGFIGEAVVKRLVGVVVPT